MKKKITTHNDILRYYRWVEALQPMTVLDQGKFKRLYALPQSGVWHLYLGPHRKYRKNYRITLLLRQGNVEPGSLQIDRVEYLEKVLEKNGELERALIAIERDAVHLEDDINKHLSEGASLEGLLDGLSKIFGDIAWECIGRRIRFQEGKEGSGIIDPKHWYMSELNALEGGEKLNKPLERYLKGHNFPKCDLLKETGYQEILSSKKPLVSRWPSRKDLTLSPGQNTAMTVMTQLMNLSDGVVGINGPPGTGKTTLVREVIAEQLAETAWRFTKTQEKFVRGWSYESDGCERPIYKVPNNLCGVGIVVASDNNAAVENISRVLPRKESVDRTFELDYFEEVASLVDGQECWGLIAAHLGSYQRTEAWIQHAWFDQKRPDKTLRVKLKEDARKKDQFALAKVRFLRSLERVGTTFCARNDDSVSRNEDRVMVFKASLAVRRAFIRRYAREIKANLSMWVDHVKGKVVLKEKEAIFHLWNTFFLIVPVFSTTFASAGRLFKGVEQGVIDWLIVDEAAQVLPHHPIGLLRRCRRSVFIGDPMQLEPVRSHSKGAIEKLERVFNIGRHHSVDTGTAQALADNASIFGAETVDIQGQRRWVGVPLRSHYRCNDPMFSTSNTISYSGSMVNVKQITHKPYLPSRWMSVGREDSGMHFGDEVGYVFRLLIEQLVDDNKGRLPDVFIVAPFKETIREARKVMKSVCEKQNILSGTALNDFLEKRMGTVHTFQGREADIMILILGLDHSRKSALAWAAESPNLLNVAATRGKERLYVIGEREPWKHYPAFEVLESHMAGHDQLETNKLTR